MTKLQRITGKLFGETATATGDDPQIGQFGSAKAGTYVGTTDVATIQNLTAWSNGFIDSVTPTTQFPPLPEMTGVLKVLSHQENYLLQEGIPEYDAGTNYSNTSVVKTVDGNGNLAFYQSLASDNLGNALSNTTYWKDITPVKKSGDTMTGNLNLSNSFIQVNDTNFPSTTPSSSKYVQGFSISGNNVEIAYLGCGYHTNGDLVTILQNKRVINNITYYNTLQLGIKDDGTSYTSLSPSDSVNSIVTTTGISKTGNGYVNLGNGIIIQWGSFTGGSNVSVTFPTAFSVIPQISFSGTQTSDNSRITAVAVNSITSTGFYATSIATNGGGSAVAKTECKWIAIGY